MSCTARLTMSCLQEKDGAVIKVGPIKGLRIGFPGSYKLFLLYLQ